MDAHCRLAKFAKETLKTIQPDFVISGMALGWDLALAEACDWVNIPFVAYLPCKGQAAAWSEQFQNLYENLLTYADKIVVVSPEYTPVCMQERNRRMVDNADHILALWNGSPGGTSNCIRYAEKIGRPVTNLWEDFDTWRNET